MGLRRLLLANGAEIGDMVTIAKLLSELAQHSAPWHLQAGERIYILALMTTGLVRTPMASTLNRNYEEFASAKNTSRFDDWALALCKKALRFGEAMFAVSLDDDSNVVVGGKMGYEQVKYKLIYRNQGDRQIALEGTLGSNPIESSENNSNLPKFHHFLLTLPANSTASLVGTLSWPGITKSAFESSVRPGGAGGYGQTLLQAYFVEPEPCGLPNISNFGAKALPYAKALWDVAQSGGSGFAALKRGVVSRNGGEEFEIENPLPMAGRSVLYAAESEPASVTARVYKGASETDARAVFLKYRDVVKNWCLAAVSPVASDDEDRFSALHVRAPLIIA